ncbi:MAG: HipA domain-containing protein [Bifidobacteriaceae bacterium]|nr:HipA domain-containing protein [Bifidobacteriaceae bacterium]
MRRDGSKWLDPEVFGGRYSLAGAQAKFALARLSGDWYWSNARVASTHILKPAPDGLREAEQIEAASMRLARMVGIDAPDAGTISALDQSSYIVERFDRDTSTFPFRRIHVEDFAQAIGLPSGRKYGVTAAQSIRLLRRADMTDEMAYGFVARLAFNAAVGNADAHAKNYSLFIRPEGLSLTPVYDCQTTVFWKRFDERLAMAVAGARRSAEITPPH